MADVGASKKYNYYIKLHFRHMKFHYHLLFGIFRDGFPGIFVIANDKIAINNLGIQSKLSGILHSLDQSVAFLLNSLCIILGYVGTLEGGRIFQIRFPCPNLVPVFTTHKSGNDGSCFACSGFPDPMYSVEPDVRGINSKGT